MNPSSRQMLGVVAIMAATMSCAQAVECIDPAWTRAITEAMGRAPKAGECNTKLYGQSHSPEERVQVIRIALASQYARRGGDNTVTQKLPLSAPIK